jgi:chromosomal replication initiator protein
MSTLEPQIIWSTVLRDLSKAMSSSSFSTWVKPLKLVSIEPVGDIHAIVHISADSPYVAQQAEMRCYVQLKQIIDRETARQCDLVFGESSTTQSQDEKNEPATDRPENDPSTSQTATSHVSSSPLFSEGIPNSLSQHTPVATARSKTKTDAPSLFSPAQIIMPTVDRYKLAAQKAHLREDYTFDSFAVSGSNEMAYAAASAVAASPGQVYNPLFLWGGVGVGKTHLMQAIGNTILKQNPEVPLTYCMGEEFLNEIIGAIRTKKQLEFKEKYRRLKILLIDDIQFIAGKDTAQEEFFHTFNAITREGGQIIMTSDRPPYEITPLEDRLRSRFEGGLTIDIQQPTFELRTAILLIKSQKMGLDLPMNLAQIVASEVESTRKLEGVIFKLHSAHRFQNKPLDENLIREILGSESKPVIARKKLKPSFILRAVTSHFRVSANTLRGPSRKKEYVTARHVAMYLLKSELDVPYAEIGHSFGGRDHTSVMHAVQKIETELPLNNLLSQHITAIRSSLSVM